LLKLHLQTLAKGAVKDRVAGGICKVGDHQGVFAGDLRLRLEKPV
jgi:hypothetical protein